MLCLSLISATRRRIRARLTRRSLWRTSLTCFVRFLLLVRSPGPHLNIFCLTGVVAVDKEGKRAFGSAEGLKLLQIMLKNKAYARRGALKLLDYVCQNDVKMARRWLLLPGL